MAKFFFSAKRPLPFPDLRLSLEPTTVRKGRASHPSGAQTA